MFALGVGVWTGLGNGLAWIDCLAVAELLQPSLINGACFFVECKTAMQGPETKERAVQEG